MSDKIRVCSNHQNKEVTPLIWTFAFDGAEYWCPACGYTGGMLGAGESIDSTIELNQRLAVYERATRQFLRAKALQVCAATRYKGSYIDPKDLPERSKKFWANKLTSWKYKFENHD